MKKEKVSKTESKKGKTIEILVLFNRIVPFLQLLKIIDLVEVVRDYV